jgi:type VI secretion system secreted protein VgrG
VGEEIFTNEHGQVKVQFHWDRRSETNENSSCWVRVSQPWAGKDWGAMFLPRIGQEVIVEFIEGDPDHPIVTGRVYNAEATPLWKLPDNKTRSGFRTRTLDGGTANFNELRFEDKKGKEEIYLHAERDHVLRTKHDRIEYIGNESHLIAEKDVFEKFKSEHHLSITGDQNIKIGGTHSIDTGQDWHGKVGMICALDAGQQIHLKGGMTVVIEAGTQLSLKVGGNFIDINPAGIFIKGTMVMINSGGAAGSGAGASPQPPKEPKEADKSQGGDKLKPPRPKKPEAYSPQAQALKIAHENAVPFCEVCAKAAAARAASGGATA